VKSDVRLDLDLDRDLHPDRPASKAAVRLPVPSCNARYFTALLCTHSDLQLLRYVALRWSWRIEPGESKLQLSAPSINGSRTVGALEERRQ